MTEANELTSVATDHLGQVKSFIDRRKLIKQSWHNHWLVRAYFGPVPFLGSEHTTNLVASLEYTACAITHDQSKGDPPCIENSDGMQVCIDDQSIVWLSAESIEALTIKIKTTFPGFTWEEEEKING